MVGSKAEQIAAFAVATAIKSTQKFGAKEHEAVNATLIAAMQKQPELAGELGEYIAKIGNRSAFSKDLAKAGLVVEGEPSAFVRRVAEAVMQITDDENKKLATMTGEKPQSK